MMLKRTIKKIARSLLSKDTPLWATLLLFAATAGLTYCIAPTLNERFEQQKIVSAYVTENLSSLNLDTRTLIADVSELSSQINAGKKNQRDIKERIVRKIIELQWRTIELQVIFESKRSMVIIAKYQKSLLALQEAVEDSTNLSNSDRLVESAIILSDCTKQVLSELAVKAGLKISTLD